MSLDFKGLAASLCADSWNLLPAWLPGGTRRGKEYVCGSIAGGQGESFSVNLESGVWKEFGNGDPVGGGDLIALYATIKGFSMGEAFKALSETHGGVRPPLKQVVATLPKESVAPPPPDSTPDVGPATASWCYRDSKGAPLYYVARYDTPANGHPAKKWFNSFSWDGHAWVKKSPPSPRPLYGLELLAARPGVPILVVEGEGKCEVARRLFDRVYVCIAWPNGCNAVKSADWSPAYGRKVLLWPDNNEVGVKAMNEVATILAKRCPEIKILDVSDLPEGHDVGDCSTWNSDEAFEWARPRASIWKPPTVDTTNMVQPPRPTAELLMNEPPDLAALQDDPEIQAANELFGAIFNKKFCKVEPREFLALAKYLLSDNFKVLRRHKAPFVYAVTNHEKKELDICLNDEFLYQAASAGLWNIGQVTTPTILKKIVDTWNLFEPSISEEPSSFAWSDDTSWTMKRLAFTPSPGQFPAWEQFLGRLSARDEFMAFVWSIFEPKNRSRQFLYLHDPAGQGGKSTIISVIAELMGRAASSLNNSMVSGSANRWLLGTLYGKRLVTWADCKNPKFCMSETLRNITSGDSVQVEFKGETPFIAPIYLKLIIGSNSAPEITGVGADTSRLIRVDVKANTDNKNDPQWVDKLRKEIPYFLDACREAYARLCLNHGDIKLSAATIEAIEGSTDAIESKWEDIVIRRIEYADDAVIDVTKWMQLCRDERLSNNEIGDFKKYLKRNSTFRFERHPDGDKKKTFYYGIKIVGFEPPNQTSWGRGDYS